jgi:tetratricopeptide (TPR) repeat protein
MKIKTLNLLVLLFVSSCAISQLATSHQQIDQALNRLQDDTSKVLVLIHYSDSLNTKGDNLKSLVYAKSALELSTKLKVKQLISQSNTQVGIVYLELGEYEKALDHYLNALKISEEINDQKGIAYIYHNIGNIYREQGDFNRSLENFINSLEISTSLNDQRGISKASFGAGIIYRLKGEYEKALDYYFKSMKIDESLNDSAGMAHTYTSIGIVYSITGLFDKALDYYSRSLEVANRTGDKKEIALCKINLGCTYIDLSMYGLAESNLLEALTLFKETGHKNGVKEVYGSLAQLFEKKGDFKQALSYQKFYNELKDELISESSAKQMLEMHAKYDSEKKIIENKALSQKNKIQALTIENNRYLILGLVVCVILIVGFGYLIFRQRKHRTEQVNKQFEQKLLRTQMNPHFIFNSLTSIESFIYEHEPKTAGLYLSKFARLMRLILENSASEFITLSQEIEILNYYISLQKLRLDDQLESSIQVHNDIFPDEVLIPPMLLQPFIENAVEHGFRGSEKKGRIEINFEIQNDLLCVRIRDNGVGIGGSEKEQQEFKSHKSMALKITHERIELLNRSRKKKLLFLISDISDSNKVETGTEVKFSIPINFK